MDLYTIQQLALWKHSEWEREAEAEQRRKELTRQAPGGKPATEAPPFKRQLGLTLIRAGEWLVKTA